MKTLIPLILFVILFYSVIPTFALDTSQTCDTITLPPRWPSSHIYVTDTNENLSYAPLTDHVAIFHDDDVWNTSTHPRTVNVTLVIHDKYSGQLFFNQTQSLQMNACSGPESVKWRFVPTQVDYYIATVSDDRGNVSMSFNSMLDTAKSQTVSSPLEQFKSGIAVNHITCKKDLHVILKAENSFPACVDMETGKKLVQRGWATEFEMNVYDYWSTCDKSIPQSNSGTMVFYMPTNSIGKICLSYSNPNSEPEPVTPPGIHDPSNSYQQPKDITIWTYTPISTIANDNGTVVAYFVKTGNQTGFYGLSVPSCGEIPFAVGYNDDSNMTSNDFPFLGVTVSCPPGMLYPQLEGIEGIDVKFIP